MGKDLAESKRLFLEQCLVDESVLADLREGNKLGASNLRKIRARIGDALNGPCDAETLADLCRSEGYVASSIDKSFRGSSFIQGGPDQGPQEVNFNIHIHRPTELLDNRELLEDGSEEIIEGEEVDDPTD